MNNLVRRYLYVPFSEINVLNYYPYTIYGKKLYQLVEDENSDRWVLQVHDMEF